MDESFHNEKKARSLHADLRRAMSAALSPGGSLEQTSAAMLSSVQDFLKDTLEECSDGEELYLFLWTKRLVTRASTSALYGAERNPFRDPAVESGLWAAHKDIAGLMLNVLPNIVCPKGYRGRATVFAGFRKYYSENSHLGASDMVKAHHDLLERYGLCDEDIAHFDLNLSLGLLINTVPATCWALYYIYSQPMLLDEIRAAMSPYVQSSEEDPRLYVNIADVVAECSLLKSMVYETLRIQSVGAASRMVLEDTLLDNRQYLLKKGATVLVPSDEIHRINSVWGPPSPSSFDANRFCTGDGGFQSKKPASGYRAFGGGSYLCPGRFLALNEIMSIVAIMVLQYDITPYDQESWAWPQSQSSLGLAIAAPKEDIRVKVRKRSRYKSGHWSFEWKSHGAKAKD